MAAKVLFAIEINTLQYFYWPKLLSVSSILRLRSLAVNDFLPSGSGGDRRSNLVDRLKQALKESSPTVEIVQQHEHLEKLHSRRAASLATRL